MADEVQDALSTDDDSGLRSEVRSQFEETRLYYGIFLDLLLLLANIHKGLRAPGEKYTYLDSVEERAQLIERERISGEDSLSGIARPEKSIRILAKKSQYCGRQLYVS